MSQASKTQLAAILFSDIVGYSAIMQRNRTEAIATVETYKKNLEAKAASFKGEVLNNYGDGSLTIFNSATDALRCAMELQIQFRQPPVVPLRIGIHIGEITFENQQAHGDGVNIASRIESIGQTGTVLFSRNVYEKVRNLPEFNIAKLGQFEFKNIEDPVSIYALANEGFPVPLAETLSGKLKVVDKKNQPKNKFRVLPALLGALCLVLSLFVLNKFVFNKEKDSLKESPISQKIDKSIAVLAFDDISPKKDQEYFSDGMVEEILNHLVKIEGLQVTSRTSSMSYKGSPKQVKEIAKELGVASILEGSVRKDGDIIRISVQLIDGKTDRQLWSQSYDEKLDSIFTIQSSIAQEVANELKVQIAPKVRQRINKVPTQNMKAYALYLQATRSGYATDKTRELLLDAIELDSTFADAYVLLAVNKLFRIIVSRFLVPEDLDRYLAETKVLFNKSLELDPNNATALRRLGSMVLWFEWDFVKAQEYFEKSDQLAPALNEEGITEYLLSIGKFDEALQNSFLTVKANPNSAYSILVQGLCHYFNNDLPLARQSIKLAEEKMDSIDIFSDGNMYRLLIFLEDYPKVLKKYKKLTKDQPSTSPRINSLAAIAYHHTGQTKQVQQILRDLKIQYRESPVGSPAFHIAMIYAQTGAIEPAFEWLEKAFQSREVEMYWLKVEPPFKPLYNDSRWQEMLDKVGFPKT